MIVLVQSKRERERDVNRGFIFFPLFFIRDILDIINFMGIITAGGEGDQSTPLRERQRLLDLRGGDWTRDGDHMIACFDLSKGESALVDG